MQRVPRQGAWERVFSQDVFSQDVFSQDMFSLVAISEKCRKHQLILPQLLRIESRGALARIRVTGTVRFARLCLELATLRGARSVAHVIVQDCPA